MIPKIIHYCWFGGNPLPELAQKCITSWKKYCPDYELVLWNEANFDINTVHFTAQVAEMKKWGFIVDYIRAHVVYHYGGIYLDTDVELLKSLDDDILQNVCFAGFENGECINPGSIFAGEKGCEIAKELTDFYATYHFIKENGELNLTPSPVIFTKILSKYGLRQNNTYQKLGVFTSYPTEYFCPLSYKTGIANITKNTYSIHHYVGSWLSEEDIQAGELRKRIYSIFGDSIFSKIITFFWGIIRKTNTHGLFFTIQYCCKKICMRKTP